MVGLNHPDSDGERVMQGILEALSKVLTQLIEVNQKSSTTQTVVTKFQSSYAPGISILAYLERISKYARCSPNCFIVALIYIDRLIEMRNILLTSLNVHRILITSVLLATKFFDDEFYRNSFYAKLGGVSTQELNSLELEFLSLISFNLFVSTPTFLKYEGELRSFASVPTPFSTGAVCSLSTPAPPASPTSTAHPPTPTPHPNTQSHAQSSFPRFGSGMAAQSVAGEKQVSQAVAAPSLAGPVNGGVGAWAGGAGWKPAAAPIPVPVPGRSNKEWMASSNQYGRQSSLTSSLHVSNGSGGELAMSLGDNNSNNLSNCCSGGSNNGESCVGRGVGVIGPPPAVAAPPVAPGNVHGHSVGPAVLGCPPPFPCQTAYGFPCPTRPPPVAAASTLVGTGYGAPMFAPPAMPAYYPPPPAAAPVAMTNHHHPPVAGYANSSFPPCFYRPPHLHQDYGAAAGGSPSFPAAVVVRSA